MVKLIQLFVFILLFVQLNSCATRQGAGDFKETGDGGGDALPPPSTPPNATDCQNQGGTWYANTCWKGADTDGDKVPAPLETYKGTDPLKADTDGDTFNDLCEILKETDPKNSNSKPSDCKLDSSGATANLDPIMKATCSLYQAQKKESEWFKNNIITEKTCRIVKSKDKEGKEQSKEICEDQIKDLSQADSPENFGDPNEAELVTMTIKVKWGVSYKDVLMISNGVMSIRPWFTYFNYYLEDFNDDDRQFDHHLGDLPSTSVFCENPIKNKAEVEVTIGAKTEYMTWQHPAFMPFKIPQYEKIYPVSTDGLTIGEDKDNDNIVVLGHPINNFSFKTHLISVQVMGNNDGEDDNETDYNCSDEDEVNGKCRQRNGMCETRTVEFKYEFFKIKESTDEDQLTLEYKDVENICKDVKL